MDDNFKIYTPDEVANMMRVQRNTVMGWIASGEMKAFKTGGRWKITQGDIDEYIEAHRNQKKLRHRRGDPASEEWLEQQARQEVLEFLTAPTDEGKWAARKRMAKLEETAGRIYGFRAMDELHEKTMAFLRQKKQELEEQAEKDN